MLDIWTYTYTYTYTVNNNEKKNILFYVIQLDFQGKLQTTDFATNIKIINK